MFRGNRVGESSFSFYACEMLLEFDQATRDCGAGAYSDPGLPYFAFAINIDDCRDHHDRDHEIASRTQLQEGRVGAVEISGNNHGRENFVGTAESSAITDEELRQPKPAKT